MHATKRATALGLLLLTLLSTVPALAGSYVAYPKGTEPDTTGFYRVALRSEPSTDGAVLYRVYNDVPLSVLGDAKNGFVPVQIGENKGYMMAKFLNESPSGKKTAMQPIGLISWPQGAIIYSSPKSSSSAVITVPYNGTVTILAVGESWHYVLYTDAATNSDYLGYMASHAPVEMENLQYGYLKNNKSNTVTLYTRPSEKSTVVVDGYAVGEQVEFLFSPNTHTDWVKIRVGGYDAGYVQRKNVEHRSK